MTKATQPLSFVSATSHNLMLAAHPAHPEHRIAVTLAHVSLLCAFAIPIVASAPRAQSASHNPWELSIVLSRLVAGQPATLAVLDSNGKLAPEVTVDLGSLHVETDDSGRAFFTAPSDADYLIARTPTSSAATLVDRLLPGATGQALKVASFASLSDSFAICGSGFRGDADANRVTLNGQAALVLAASPQCLVVLPGPRARAGQAKIVIDAAGMHWEGSTTLVSLHFEAPTPPVKPQQKSVLLLQATGTNQLLEISVQNESPDVIRFLRGDTEILRTSGGSPNLAAVEIEAIRSGDFSFHAKLAPQLDASAAERYLRAALPLAPRQLAPNIRKLARKIAHPKNLRKIQSQLDDILREIEPGNFRVLLEAARENL